MVKKIQITLGNKTFYTLIVLASIAIIASIAFAYNSSYSGAVPGSRASVMGHTADEIDGIVASGGGAVVGWVKIADVAGHGANLAHAASGYVAWMQYSDKNDHSLEKICQDAGYTTFTGACKDVYSGNPLQGSVLASNSTAYPSTGLEVGEWSITCLFGNGHYDMHSETAQILCIKSGGGSSGLTDSSMQQNGYAQIGDLLIQWGDATLGDQETGYPVNFPIQFSQVYSVVASRKTWESGNMGLDDSWINVYNVNNTGFKAFIERSSGGGVGPSAPVHTYWQAIGKK
jgi:hypothetical protein